MLTIDTKINDTGSVSVESQGAISKRSTMSFHNRADLSRIEQIKPDRALKNKPSKSKEK